VLSVRWGQLVAGPRLKIDQSLGCTQMTSFSTRMGITQPKAIQTDDMDTELRNSLWNICRHFFFTQNQHTSVLAKDGRLHYIASELYVKHYKFPVDNLPFQSSDFVKMQLARFQNAHGSMSIILSNFCMLNVYAKEALISKNLKAKLATF
jgi:hypothetical protein